MPRQLYDRIISVSLYQPSVRKTVKVIANVNKKAIGVHQSNSRQNEEIYIVEFYPTFKHKGESGKTIVANGPLFSFRTESDMLYGVRPDGSPFKNGDRVRILDTGATYHVYKADPPQGMLATAEKLYTQDLSIDTASHELKLTCPDYGMKPDIAFTVNLLPGQNCYKMTLKIRNLNTDLVDIRDWKKMVITAGYKGIVTQFTCPIFSSYVESPNPDGITVFEGLTIGNVDTVLYPSRIEVHFDSESFTVGRLLYKCVPLIGPGVTLASTVPPEIWGIKVSTVPRTYYAENGLALLNWLQTTVTQIVYNATRQTESNKEGTSILLSLYNNVVYVQTVNGPTQLPEFTDNIVNLDMISSAVFNGSALTVEAMWDPRLKPGDLFYMPPEFLNGSKLPNTISRADYRNPHNLYRALTMSIQFATVQNTNRMTILAVPAQYANQIITSDTLDLTSDRMERMWNESEGQRQDNKAEVHIGELNTGKESSQAATEKPVTGLDTFDKSSQVDTLWGAIQSIEHRDYMGSCLSVIAMYYCEKMEGGPKLRLGTKGTTDEDHYYISMADIDKANSGVIQKERAKQHFQNEGIRDYMIWFPLIFTATYWAKEEADKNSISNNYTPIDISNPDFIVAGRSVAIPAWPGSWTAVKNKISQNPVLRDIYKNASIEFSAKYPSYSAAWREFYYLMGGTDDIG